MTEPERNGFFDGTPIRKSILFLVCLLVAIFFLVLTMILTTLPSKIPLTDWQKANSITIKRSGELTDYCLKYRELTGAWPTSINRLAWVIRITNSQVLTDGWGHPFIIRSVTNHSASTWIISYGADGLPGGKGSNADVLMELQ